MPDLSIITIVLSNFLLMFMDGTICDMSAQDEAYALDPKKAQYGKRVIEYVCGSGWHGSAVTYSAVRSGLSVLHHQYHT